MLIRKERLEKIVEKKIRDRILEISTEEVEIKSLVGRRIIVLNDSASWISEGTVYENTFSEYEFINRLSKDVIFCRCFGSPYSLKAVIVFEGEKRTDGHYYTFICHDQEWIEYNDGKVIKHTDYAKIQPIFEQHNYIFIYTDPKKLS